MSIAKKVTVAAVLTAALATAVVMGAKYNEPINSKVNYVQTRISKVFTKNTESQKVEESAKKLSSDKAKETETK